MQSQRPTPFFHCSSARALLLAVGLAIAPPAAAADVAPAAQPSEGSSVQRQIEAQFSGEAASAEAREVASWILTSRDHHDLPFLIVDKANAKLFLFSSEGTLLAATPVLLGLARGDDSPPEIGQRELSLITSAERITPAGRFVADQGLNLTGQDILWVDYDSAISLHRATDSKPGLTAKSRLERLTSASTLDNRISHGCINVSGEFYERFIQSTFSRTSGIVYILPETRSIRDVFPMAQRSDRQPEPLTTSHATTMPVAGPDAA
jgi:hypothetical protein